MVKFVFADNLLTIIEFIKNVDYRRHTAIIFGTYGSSVPNHMGAIINVTSAFALKINLTLFIQTLSSG